MLRQNRGLAGFAFVLREDVAAVDFRARKVVAMGEVRELAGCRCFAGEVVTGDFRLSMFDVRFWSLESRA